MTRGAPSNVASLGARIDNLARARRTTVRRIQRAVANVVIGQMLPPGVVKGGTAMKLRVGEPGSRFTPDFDATRLPDSSIIDYLEALRDRLGVGWGGFAGTVEVLTSDPADVAAASAPAQPRVVRI